jgi:uncharacterized protein (TIGR03435 family)
VRDLILALSFAACAAAAQTLPSFDAVSLRACSHEDSGLHRLDGETSGGPGSADPGRLVYSRVPLRQILLDAFEVPIDQLSGPEWTESECYDIVAKVPPHATKQESSAMLQSLLIERLRLRFHRQSKEFDGYDLVVAPGGPSFPGQEAAEVSRALPPEDQRQFATKEGSTYFRFRDYSMEKLAHWLGVRLGTQVSRPGMPDSFFIAAARINNKTGLNGIYDFALKYAGAMMAAERFPLEMRERLDLQGPSIFAALEKQLGLRLEKTKVAVEVIVIDQVEKAPVEN